MHILICSFQSDITDAVGIKNEVNKIDPSVGTECEKGVFYIDYYTFLDTGVMPI